MHKPTLFLLIGLAAGIVTAAVWPTGPDELPTRDAPPAGLAARVAALEEALNRETLRRSELERELSALEARTARADAVATGDGEVAEASPTRPPSDARDESDAAGEAPPPRAIRRRFGRDGGEALTERLVAGGFSPDRAAWIEARASELRMQALQAQYEARLGGEPFNPRAAGADALRSELGDAEYERYLEALGRPTSVRVDGVIDNSPAAQAGLAPGDRVVSYGGERVFGLGDLNARLLEGTPGEPVTVDVLRDGQPIQLVLPRGPLGIWGPGRGFGRR